MIFVSTIVTPTYRRFAPFQPSKELAFGNFRLRDFTASFAGRPLAGRPRGTNVPVRIFSYSLFSILAECMIPE